MAEYPSSSSRRVSSWVIRMLFVLMLLLVIFVGTRSVPPKKPLSPRPQPHRSTQAAFVKRSGSSLLLNGQKFRFSGANIYWLGLLETKQGVMYPSPFEVDDALATARAMGATVIRSHTLGISVGCPLCVESGRGVFNQEAFQHIDFALQVAASYGMRVIIPLVDNWHYYHGGKHTFTDWLGLSNEDLFYYDPQAISDFQRYVSTLLNHVNTYTGIAYKNDPAILAWELGNELRAPLDWEEMMASYIKSIDANHLIGSGNYSRQGQEGQQALFAQDLALPAIDMYPGHYYPPSVADLQEQATTTRNAQKVFIAEEYDWNTTDGDPLSRFLAAIEQSDIAGDLYWSLFPHSDTYGYVQQEEHFTLHYPGDTPDIQVRVRLLCAHAYALHGFLAVGTLPGTPVITSVEQNKIFWRGAAGASTYTIERSQGDPNGPWTVICDRCASDRESPWTDTSQPGGPLWYRMKASSASGTYGLYSAPYPISP